jgi:hypothetical protein
MPRAAAGAVSLCPRWWCDVRSESPNRPQPAGRAVTARCCAVGKCCHQVASPRTITDIRTVLRSGLNSAVRQELLDRTVAKLMQIPKQRKRKLVPWTSEEARRFLESARSSSDPLTPRVSWLWFWAFARRRRCPAWAATHPMPQSSFPLLALFCGVVLVAAEVGVLAHSGWWPQAAMIGAAGSIVLLLLTFTPWWLLALAIAIDIAIVVLSWRTLSR